MTYFACVYDVLCLCVCRTLLVCMTFFPAGHEFEIRPVFNDNNYILRVESEGINSVKLTSSCVLSLLCLT